MCKEKYDKRRGRIDRKRQRNKKMECGIGIYDCTCKAEAMMEDMWTKTRDEEVKY